MDTPRPWLARASLALTLLPAVFLALLLAGGGSSGFGAWNDIGRLLILMVGCAVLGLVLGGFSLHRGERSMATGFAIFFHVIYLVLVLWALGQ